jgi:hypothetical protein
MALDERLRVAGSLLGKGEALVGVGRYDEAVAYYGQVTGSWLGTHGRTGSHGESNGAGTTLPDSAGDEC